VGISKIGEVVNQYSRACITLGSRYLTMGRYKTESRTHELINAYYGSWCSCESELLQILGTLVSFLESVGLAIGTARAGRKGSCGIR
jgi:hypothetical protein